MKRELVDYGKLRADLADRVVYDPDCKSCERASPINVTSVMRADGWVPEWDRNVWVKPCSSCAQRRPYAWLLKIPLDKFIAWVDDPANECMSIDGMRELLPEVRGSSRFEFL